MPNKVWGGGEGWKQVHELHGFHLCNNKTKRQKYPTRFFVIWWNVAHITFELCWPQTISGYLNQFTRIERPAQSTYSKETLKSRNQKRPHQHNYNYTKAWITNIFSWCNHFPKSRKREMEYFVLFTNCHECYKDGQHISGSLHIICGLHFILTEYRVFTWQKCFSWTHFVHYTI